MDAGEAAAPLEYVVRDYWGKEAAAGKAKVAEGTVEVTLKLAAGYYDLEFPATQQRFGMAAIAPFAGKADPFFAIDSALSWLVHEDELREGLVRVLARSGIRMSRERLTWGGVHPAAEKWEWESGSRFDTLRRACAQHGVEVLEMCHDGPAWMGHVGRYPDNLPAAARSWRQIAQHWRPTWGAVEVWNEPDIFFGGNLPADQYAAVVKAIAHGMDGHRDVPLVGGVMAHDNRAFLDVAARNGVLECVDVFSFHTYAQAPAMEALVGRYRAWLRAFGREPMPLWITECGRPWAKGPDRPPVDQDALSALDITMKAVEARACGIARHFPFVYPYYEENQNNFGMMDRRGTPLRSMAAYAQMAARLAHKPYLGDLRCDDPRVVRARLFGDGRETLAVLYTGKPDAAAGAKLGVPALRAEGIDGRKLEIAANGAVPVPDGLSYVWLDRGKLGDRLQTDTAAAKLRAIAQQLSPPRAARSPVVLRFQWDAKLLKPQSEGYRLLEPPAEKMPLTVRAFNLSDQPSELTFKFTLPNAATGIPVVTSITGNVQAQGLADVIAAVDLRDAFAKSDRVTITVTAEGKDAGRIAPLSVDLLGEATVAQLLRRYPRRARLPIEEQTRWQANAPGHAKMSMSVSPEKTWRLGVSFGKGDRWVYPYFRLPDGMDLSKAVGLVLRARCEKPAAVRVFLWEGDRGVGYITPGSIVAPDGKWHAAVVRFDDLVFSTANAPDPNNRLDLQEVRRISIGMNSEADQNALEIGEGYVVGP
jgi:hypothetical protein